MPDLLLRILRCLPAFCLAPSLCLAAAVTVDLNVGTPLATSDGRGDGTPLSVNVVVFDAGLGAPSQQVTEVFPKLRSVETRYLAYALRKTLGDSVQWAAVRVMPEGSVGAEVQLTGRIIASDGMALVLQIEVRDASDTVWFAHTYQAAATASRYEIPILEDPFQPLFNRIANDMVAARDALPAGRPARLVELAGLRYAAALLPSVFSEYLEQNEDGTITPVRLPALGDPTMTRIERIRESEYFFTDTLDTGFGVLFEELRVNYTLWRKYSYEEVVGLERYRASTARNRRDDGSLDGMMRRYGDFRELKLQQSSLREAAETLNTDIAPTAVEVEGTIVNLTGSLDERYREWRSLLRSITAEETGLPD